jgi:hypothetical protein
VVSLVFERAPGPRSTDMTRRWGDSRVGGLDEVIRVLDVWRLDGEVLDEHFALATTTVESGGKNAKGGGDV